MKRTTLLTTLGLALLFCLWIVLGEPDRHEASLTTVKESSPTAEHRQPFETPVQAPTRPPERTSAVVAEDRRLVRVRVLDEATKATIGGTEVKAISTTREGTYLLGFEEDSPGVFFAEPVPPGSFLHVDFPPGWKPMLAEVEAPSKPGQEVFYFARRVPLGILEGTVVDVESASPVPWFDVCLDDEDLLTDAQGHFRGTREHQEGPLKVSSRGGSRSEGMVHGWSPASAEPLVVGVWSESRLFLKPDFRPEECDAYWRPRSSGSVICTEEDETARGVLLSEPDRVYFDWRAPGVMDRGEVVLTAPKEFLVGTVRLAPGCGTFEDPLPVAFKPCGVLELHVELSARPNDRLTLVIEGPEPSSRYTSEFSNSWDYTVLLTVPGVHSARVESGGTALAEKTIFVALMEREEVRLDVSLEPRAERSAPVPNGLGPRPELFQLSVRVVGSRNAPSQGRLLVAGRAARFCGLEEELTWTKQDGRWEAIVSTRLEAGDYLLCLQTERDFDWSGPREIALPDAGSALLTIRDDTPTEDVFFDALAEESDQPLPVFTVECFFESGKRRSYSGNRTQPVLVGHPRDRGFDWIVHAPGRRSVLGRHEPGDAASRSETRVRVELEAGASSSRLLRAVAVGGPYSGRGVSGLGVFSGASFLGTTSISGHLMFDHEHVEPLRIVHETYRLASLGYSDVDDDGSFDPDLDLLWVEVAPVEGR